MRIVVWPTPQLLDGGSEVVSVEEIGMGLAGPSWTSQEKEASAGKMDRNWAICCNDVICTHIRDFKNLISWF